jgi:hypothetical protein
MESPLADLLVKAEKQASISVVNPITGEEFQTVHLKGVFGKGCKQTASLAAEKSVFQNWPRLSSDLSKPPKIMELKVFEGTLKSDDLVGDVVVRLNPTLESMGREESLQPGSEYPKMQEFRQYTLFAIQMKVGGQTIKMTVGNKKEDPIWVRVKLNRPFGEELPLQYKLVKDRTPLWQWNDETNEFYEISPLTGEPAQPVAYILKEHDDLVIRRMWKREIEPQTGAVKFVKFGKWSENDPLS